MNTTAEWWNIIRAAPDYCLPDLPVTLTTFNIPTAKRVLGSFSNPNRQEDVVIIKLLEEGLHG